MTFVLDNSITMRWLFNDGKVIERAFADKVLSALERTNAIVPAIWALEVANVISRAEARGQLLSSRSDSFIERLSGFRIDVDHDTFVRAFSDTLELSRAYNLTSYDASYLELSRRSGLPLATLDEKLKKAAKKAGVRIFV